MAITLDTDFSLYTIPIMFVVGLQPHVQKIGLMGKCGVPLDNINPREMESKVEKKGVPHATMQQIRRLAAAHSNSAEVLPYFASAVLAGHYAGLPIRTLNIFSASFVAIRVAYNIVYGIQTTPLTALLRSTLYWAGQSGVLYVLVKSANVVMNKTA